MTDFGKEIHKFYTVYTFTQDSSYSSKSLKAA